MKLNEINIPSDKLIKFMYNIKGQFVVLILLNGVVRYNFKRKWIRATLTPKIFYRGKNRNF